MPKSSKPANEMTNDAYKPLGDDLTAAEKARELFDALTPAQQAQLQQLAKEMD